ncbi:MAG: hypothetical protein AAGU75_20650 [Bacillota bacterium]|jgi:hypothetical protein
MDTSSISDVTKIRFLAVNYTRLQGLRAIPVGLFAILMTLWANQQKDLPVNYLLPILCGLLCLGLNFIIDRMYRKTFGNVSATPHNRQIELITVVIGVAIALVAVWLDNGAHLPFSAIGLVLAVAMMADYFRMVYFARSWYKPLTILTLFCSLVIAMISIFPALGFDNWWLQIGIRVEILAVFMVTGVVMIIFGLISHNYFIQTLSKEGSHD